MNEQRALEVTRLHNLADYIESHPKKYNQASPDSCVVGLGNRLRGKRLHGHAAAGLNITRFGLYFGISEINCWNIYQNQWKDVIRSFTNKGGWDERPVEQAIKFLRTIADRKEKGKKF